MTSVDKAEKRNVIFEYLNEFCSAGQEVDFAVLLKGKWGAGKTHLIDGFLEQRKSRKDYDPLIKDLYISLNGMDNATQIDHACFKALHPILGSKAAKITVEAFKAAFRTLKFDIDNVGSIGVPVPDVGLDSENFKKKIGIIVFDDLERCQMPIQASLGYINYFIEQLHLKVIVIANEEEIQADSNRLNDYRRIKEKFIGRTVSVESDTDSALDNFISYIKDSGLRQILKEREAELIDMYNKSETYNLRILKQSLWDFERFYSALDSSHIANKLFFDAIFKIIIVFSFEMRAGRLIAEQLDAPIPSKLLRVMRGKDKEKCFIDKIEERYSVTDFDNFYVDHKTLKQFLFDGWVQAEKVRAEINQSAAFAPARELPSWKIAANLWHATDDQIEKSMLTFLQS
jgi:hypothetical protein